MSDQIRIPNAILDDFLPIEDRVDVILDRGEKRLLPDFENEFVIARENSQERIEFEVLQDSPLMGWQSA